MKEAKDITSAYQHAPAGNDALNAILQDGALLSELRALGLSPADIAANLPLISNYQEDREYCRHCPGLENCAKDMPKCAAALSLEDGRLTRSLGPCALLMQRNKLMNNYLYRDFPEEWLAASLANLARSARVKSAFAAFQFAATNSQTPWAYLTGKSGAGKSYLLAAFTNGEVEHDKRVAFLNANKEFDLLKGLSIKDKNAFQKAMADLSNADVVVFDDFGSEYKSDYVRDQIVMPLLNERSKKRALTFFASDYSLNEIETLYATSHSGEIMAKQLVALIRGNLPGGKETLVEKGFETFLGTK